MAVREPRARLAMLGAGKCPGDGWVRFWDHNRELAQLYAPNM
jgi:hypothetical protein